MHIQAKELRDMMCEPHAALDLLTLVLSRPPINFIGGLGTVWSFENKLKTESVPIQCSMLNGSPARANYM